MPTCCAAQCTNVYKRGCGITFHLFPWGDIVRLAGWVQNVRRGPDWFPRKSERVCSVHFEEGCFDRTGQTVRLKPDAFPTIFDEAPKIKVLKSGKKCQIKERKRRTDLWKTVTPDDYLSVEEKLARLMPDITQKEEEEEEDEDQIEVEEAKVVEKGENDATYIVVVGDENLNAEEDLYILNTVSKFGKDTGQRHCRLCLGDDSLLFTIFGKELRLYDVTLEKVLEICTGVNITEGDELSDRICQVCFSRVESVWAFREQCKTSDRTMREIKKATKTFCQLSENTLLQKAESETGEIHQEETPPNETDAFTNKSQNLQKRFSDTSSGQGSGRRKQNLKVLRMLENAPDGTDSQRFQKGYCDTQTGQVDDTEELPRVASGMLREHDYHLKSEENYERFRSSLCDICGMMKETAEEVSKHKEEEHREAYPFRCRLCEREFKKESALSFHLKSAHGKEVTHRKRTIACPYCRAKVSKSRLPDHYLKHKRRRINSCAGNARGRAVEEEEEAANGEAMNVAAVNAEHGGETEVKGLSEQPPDNIGMEMCARTTGRSKNCQARIMEGEEIQQRLQS